MLKKLLGPATDITNLYHAFCNVFILVLFLYWFGGELLPILDFMIMLPWVFFVGIIIFMSFLYFWKTKETPIFGIIVTLLWSIPFLFTLNFVAPPLAPKSASQIKICSLNTKYFFEFD